MHALRMSGKIKAGVNPNRLKPDFDGDFTCGDIITFDVLNLIKLG